MVLVPVVLGIIQYGSPELFFALVLAAVLGGWREYVELSRNMGFDVYPWVGAILCVLLLVCFYFNDYFSFNPIFKNNISIFISKSDLLSN